MRFDVRWRVVVFLTVCNICNSVAGKCVVRMPRMLPSASAGEMLDNETHVVITVSPISNSVNNIYSIPSNMSHCHIAT